jgi:proline iminopeptidase
MTQTIDVNGARLVYDEAGTDIDGTIIVLHGGRGIGDHTGELAAYRALGDRYRVIGYDQRGHGRSSLTPPFSFAQLSDDLEALRLALVGKPIVLIGGSFGGMIALTHAIRHPAGLSHLVLRGTAASDAHQEGAIRNVTARLGRASSGSVAMVHKIFSDQVIDDIELRLIWLALQPLYFEAFDPDAALERTRTLAMHAQTHNALFREAYDVRAGLPQIACPTLVMCGAEDWICPPDQSEEIAAAIPGAELFIVPGANHAVHHEANGTVLARLRDFLQRR